jgi:hypothetical protein
VLNIADTLGEVKTGILLTMEVVSKQRLQLAAVQEKLIEALEVIEGKEEPLEVPPMSEPSERAARRVKRLGKGEHWTLVRNRLQMQKDIDGGWMTAEEIAGDIGTTVVGVRSVVLRHGRQLLREKAGGKNGRLYMYKLR